MMADNKSSQKTVAIVGGTGSEGRGLAARLARNGYQIYIGSRSLEKAEKTREVYIILIEHTDKDLCSDIYRCCTLFRYYSINGPL